MPGPEISDQEYKKIFKILNELKPFPDYLVISGSIPEGVSDDIYAEMAAGSAAVMTPGTELCTKEDTDRLYQQMTANRF